jgi:TolB-like protein
MENTNGQQVPWEASSLTGDFYFKADQQKAQTKLADILPTYKEKLAKLPDYESLRQTQAAKIRSIAVMPFSNYTGDDSKAYLASGMQDAVITELGQLNSVRVISKTSTLKYADLKNTIQEVATELNVDGIIETSLIGLGENLRIQVKLYSAFPQEQLLWSEVYTSEMSDILTLYNQVTKNIADEIQLSLSSEQVDKLEEETSVNAEAYDSYLMGLYLLKDVNLESLNKAKEYLNSAIEKNPDWAAPYSGLAQLWMTIVQMGYESPDIGGMKIFENLNKALELDPDNAYVHYTLGMSAFLNEWDWQKAEMELLKALASNPNDAMSRVIYAHLLSCLQRPDEALKQARLALELDPLNPLVRLFCGAVYSFMGDFKTFLAYAERVTADDPSNFMANTAIELSAYRLGNYNKVMEAAKYVFAAKEEEIDFKEAERIFGESGFTAAYEEILRQFELIAQKGYTAPVEMAYRYMMVNKQGKAMEWLEKGFDLHDPVMPYIVTHGFLFEPLFNNPSFIEIVQKMNLPLPIK